MTKLSYLHTRGPAEDIFALPLWFPLPGFFRSLAPDDPRSRQHESEQEVRARVKERFPVLWLEYEPGAPQLIGSEGGLFKTLSFPLHPNRVERFHGFLEDLESAPGLRSGIMPSCHLSWRRLALHEHGPTTLETVVETWLRAASWSGIPPYELPWRERRDTPEDSAVVVRLRCFEGAITCALDDVELVVEKLAEHGLLKVRNTPTSIPGMLAVIRNAGTEAQPLVLPIDDEYLAEMALPPIPFYRQRLEMPGEDEVPCCNRALEEIDIWLAEGPHYQGDLSGATKDLVFIRSIEAAPRGIPTDPFGSEEDRLRLDVVLPVPKLVENDSSSAFVPPPSRTVESWRTDPICNVLFPEGCVYPATPESWEVRAVLTDEWAAPIEGYDVHYPTATDVLMWLRWQVLPTIEVGSFEVMDVRPTEIELRGKVKDLADWIDSRPPGTCAQSVMAHVFWEIVEQEIFEDDLADQRGNFGLELFNYYSPEEQLARDEEDARDEEEDAWAEATE